MESEQWDEDSEKSKDEQASLCMILAEEKKEKGVIAIGNCKLNPRLWYTTWSIMM